jgi:integrase
MRVLTYKRGKVWWLRWTENGRTERETTGCSTREAAERVRRRRELELADPDHAAKNAATVSDAVTAFLRELRATRREDGSPVPEGTLSMYEQKTGHLVRVLPARLAEVNVASVERYFETRRDEGASYSTLYKEWVALSQTLKGAQRRGLFDHAISTLKPRWLKPGYEPRETFLSREQIPRLLAELEPERRGMVAFILATGARWGEAVRHQPADLDRATWLVHVRGTKTKKADRRFIVPEAMRGLLDHVSGSFPAWGNVGRDLERACRRAQLRLAKEHERATFTPLFPTVTPNDLRRTFASLLVQTGVALEVVAKLMGHASTAMVFKVYGQETPESLAQKVASPGVPIVPLVYQTEPEPVDSADPLDASNPVFAAVSSGPTGTRTLDLRIKSPQL